MTAPKLLIATRSQHKLRELRALLELPGGVVVSLDDAGIDDDPEETGTTFETNAAIKARAGVRASGLATLADDSGLEVDVLGGRPGVWTRRYAGPNATDEENNAKLLDELRGIDPEQRTARYVCVLTLALPTGVGPRGGIALTSTRGSLRGRISTSPRGTGGFGYDPIFEPWSEPIGGRTLGEWSAEAKNSISHRANAARRMRRHLGPFRA